MVHPASLSESNLPMCVCIMFFDVLTMHFYLRLGRQSSSLCPIDKSGFIMPDSSIGLLKLILSH
jgi:hypothetical protein